MSLKQLMLKWGLSLNFPITQSIQLKQMQKILTLKILNSELADNSSFDMNGIWVFSGILNTDYFPEEEKEKYNGWTIHVIQEGNEIFGYDGDGNETINGTIVGNSVKFYMHIDDDPSVCGDFSDFVGTIQANNGSNQIVGTLTGHDCANNPWDGEFTITIVK